MTADQSAFVPSSKATYFFYLLLVLMAAGTLFSLHTYPLVDLDEGAFSSATFEMFARHDFLFTYLNGEPRYDKPILIYWLQAASVSLFGMNEFGFRLPSTLCGLVWAGLSYRFATRLKNPEAGLMAAVVTLAAVGPAFIFRVATADSLLNLCIAGAVYSQFLWIKYQERKEYYLSWMFIGLGFLTKGPVAVLFPVALLMAYCASFKQWPVLKAYVLNFRGPLLALLIAMPWYVAVTVSRGWDFIINFILVHNLGRFSGGMGTPHAYGRFYYVLVGIIVFIPFTTVFIKSLVELKTTLKQELGRYALILFFMVFTLFTISTNKLPHYLLYGVSAALMWVAFELNNVRHRLHLIPGLLLIGLMAALPFLLQNFAGKANNQYQLFLDNIDVYFGFQYQLIVCTALLIVIFFIIDKRYSTGIKLLTTGAMISILMSLVLLPAAGNLLQGPIKKAGQIAKNIDAPLVMYGVNMPSITLYAERVVYKRAPQVGDLVLLPNHRLSDFSSFSELFRDGNIVLIRVQQ